MRCFGSSGAVVLAGGAHAAQQGTGGSGKTCSTWRGLCAVVGGAARGGTALSQNGQGESVQSENEMLGELEDSCW